MTAMTHTAASGITVRGLTKRFGRDTGLTDVDVTVAGGGFTLITGAAGSGRSTLIRCVTGVYRPDAGRVTLRLDGHDEIDVTKADPRAVAWLRGHHIASFDGPLAAAPQLPAVSAVARAARRDQTAAVAALTRLRAEHLASVPVGRLRPAERSTVALAAALSAGRRFVVLDEPENSAEPAAVRRWIQRAARAGAAVIATGPAESALAAIATTTGELRKGRIQWRTR